LMLIATEPENACGCSGLKRTAKRTCWLGGVAAGNAGTLISWNAAGTLLLIAIESIWAVPAPLLLTRRVTVDVVPTVVAGNSSVEPSRSDRTLLVSGSMYASERLEIVVDAESVPESDRPDRSIRNVPLYWPDCPGANTTENFSDCPVLMVAGSSGT